MKKTAFYISLLFFVASISRCKTKENPYATLETFLMRSNIDLKDGKYSSVISFNDNSCDVCYKSLEYYIGHMKDTNYLFLYISGSRKVTYKNTVVSRFVPEHRFRLVPDMQLYTIISGLTNDYKGSYEIKLKDGDIETVSAINNF